MARSDDLSDISSSMRGRSPSSHSRDYPSSKFSRDTQSSKAGSSASAPAMSPSPATTALESVRSVRLDRGGSGQKGPTDVPETVGAVSHKPVSTRTISNRKIIGNVLNKRRLSFDSTSLAPRKIQKLRSDRSPARTMEEAISDSEEEGFVIKKGEESGDESSGNGELGPEGENRPIFKKPKHMAYVQVPPLPVGKQKQDFVSPRPKLVDVLSMDNYIDDDIVLAGESPISNEDDIPVRLLHEVSIFHKPSGEMVPLAQLLDLQLGRNDNYVATGEARAWIEQEEDEDEDENENENDDDYGRDDDDDDINSTSTCSDALTKIHTTQILDFTFYDYVDEKMNKKIYIRTKSAWYILGRPSELYRSYYVPFWTQVYILHLVVAEVLHKSKATYDEFVEDFNNLQPENKSVVSAKLILGHKLDRDDLEQDDIKSFLAGILDNLWQDCGLSTKLKNSPLLKYFMVPVIPCNSTLERRPKLLEQARATVVTPIIGRVAEQLFNHVFQVVGEQQGQEGHEVAEEIEIVKEHNDDPMSIIWGAPATKNGQFFTSVKIDGVEYQAGEVVMVIPGKDSDKIREQNNKTAAAQSVNQYGNQLWFCQIFYFFEEKGQKLFHGQWLVHGSKTILQEAAHSKSLYLINSCASNPVASIFKKCEVKILEGDEKEPHDDQNPRAENYHCGFLWDEEHAAFLNLPTKEEYSIAFHTLPSHCPCYVCGLEAVNAEAKSIRLLPKGFALSNVAYHINDFVYIQPISLENCLLLKIGQIVGISGTKPDIKVQVRYLGRYTQARKGKNVMVDERHLYSTFRIGELKPEELDGKCFVQFLDDEEEIFKWTKHNDHFFLNQKGHSEQVLFDIKAKDLEFCEKCFETRREELARAENLFKVNGPLQGLELFSGAGGFGTGMELSEFVDTKWAVEYSPVAAKTYARNHPMAKVYCQDSSCLLQHTIDVHQGKNVPPLQSNHNEICPPMPNRGEVDFIFGGPPCQSFSGANHNKQADDIRSTMPCNMLSYLEHYYADYFLLENVRGLIGHPLLSEQNGRALSGGIKAGMVKFIMRALVALAYQVQWKVLQAGQYGAPQNRERVIFWAAKRGLALPKHPVPLYAWKKGAISPLLPTGAKLPPPTRSLIPGVVHQYAPLMPITVKVAIGDLPIFDWINPHTIVRPTKADLQFDSQRSQILGIPQFDAVLKDSNEFDSYPGYPHGTEYETGPQNRFQMWMRKGMGNKVEGHYTKRFSLRSVEATTTVPLEEGADHTSLPLALQPKHRNEPKTKKIFYGRLSNDGHFACTMTQLTPGTKNARPLHPEQRRMVTVRELARSQGFPDSYVFETTGSGSAIFYDQIRQIGNAVPVPMALALGKELGAALAQRWHVEQEKGRRDGSPVL